MTDASYQYKGGTYFENNRPEMLAFVPATVTRVLEVGCGGAAFAALLKSQRTVHVTGIEAFPGAAELARQRLDRLLSLPIEAALPALQDERFDCIVLNDVLEHLVDPWDVLARLRAHLTPDGVLVASIPNVRYLPVFKHFVFRGQWRYEADGVLDRTHLRFFTRRSMVDLFESSGYRVGQIQGLHPVQVSLKFELLNKLMRGALEDTRFQQFACVARSADAS